MRKLLIGIILIFVLFGCKITGNYFSGDGLNYTNFILNKDSTFTYETFNDIEGTTTIKGKWTKNKKILTLNSFEQPTFKPNSTYEKFIPNQDKKLIVIQNMDVSAYSTIISLNNGQEIDTLNFLFDTTLRKYNFTFGVTGVYTTIDLIKNIRILKTNNWTDCVLKDSLFYISNPKANFIIIYSQPYNHYNGMNYFVNSEWELNHNKIYIWRQTKSKYNRNNYLQKK